MQMSVSWRISMPGYKPRFLSYVSVYASMFIVVANTKGRKLYAHHKHYSIFSFLLFLSKDYRFYIVHIYRFCYVSVFMWGVFRYMCLYMCSHVFACGLYMCYMYSYMWYMFNTYLYYICPDMCYMCSYMYYICSYMCCM